MIGEKMALTRKYDVIVLDIIIPGKNGIELCRKIKEVKPSTPVLMLTALGTTEDKVTGFEAGADDYLLKPFEFAELVARIKALTRRNKMPSDHNAGTLEFADLKLELDKKVAIRGGSN